MSGRTCHACGRDADTLTFARDAGMLCAPCFEEAKTANLSRTDVPPCIECGATLSVREEELSSFSGTVFYDCPTCDRTHVAFVGEPVRLWHEHQPRCECGQYARYAGRPVAFGKRPEDDVWTYHCRGCGRHIEVRTDRIRFDIPQDQQNLRPPRVRVTKAPS